VGCDRVSASNFAISQTCQPLPVITTRQDAGIMKSNKILIILFICVGITFMNCTKKEIETTYALNGAWKVVSFNDLVLNTSITKSSSNTWTDFNNGDISVNFSNSGSTKGIISGKNVTNQFSGEYSIRPENRIIIDKLISTEINEPQWAIMFHQIEKAENFNISGSTLTIYYNQNKSSITLEKE
jgi:hypothetical protein